MRRFLLIALVVGILPFAGTTGRAAGTGIQYVTVDDGTEIAVQVFLPSGYDASKKYPALLEVEGYGGASAPNDNTYVGTPDYVVVAMSLRGTGCSAGTLSLFSDRSSMDGAWVVDNWIPNQAWSNGLVGIYGHSYGGLEGFLTASFVPDTTHLKAVAVSGLIDDFYRGILYPGGINNYGFPLLWGAGLRPVSEHSSNASYLADAHCAANYASHQTTDSVPPPQIALDTYGSPFTKDPVTQQDTWGIRQSLIRRAPFLKAPIQLGQQYQDEQTGPRGGHVLWQNIPSSLPHRIAISTGMHNPNDPQYTKKDWLDCWIIQGGNTGASSLGMPGKTSGKPCAQVFDPAKRVMLYFESRASDRLAPYFASDWPLPETDWKHFSVCADGSLAENGSESAACDGSVSYVNTGNSRHLTADFGKALPLPTNDQLSPYGFTTGLPDTARFTYTFGQTSVIAGPIDLTMYASITSADTNFWAEILDKGPDGATTFVQRGLLRAAAAAGFESSLSKRTPGGDIYRPYYDYTFETFQPVTPGAVNKYEIEIFPLGHVWRAGHQLVLQLHAPPASDPLSTYAYEPTTPSVVTVVHDGAHPTSILLPFQPAIGSQYYRATAPACGEVVGELCITPTLG